MVIIQKYYSQNLRSTDLLILQLFFKYHFTEYIFLHIDASNFFVTYISERFIIFLYLHCFLIAAMFCDRCSFFILLLQDYVCNISRQKNNYAVSVSTFYHNKIQSTELEVDRMKFANMTHHNIYLIWRILCFDRQTLYSQKLLKTLSC